MTRYQRVRRSGEAVFWNGTNNDEVINWVEDRTWDRARYTPREREPGFLEAIEDEEWPAFPGSITVRTPTQILRLRPNEWLFRDEDGEYTVMDNRQFQHEYEIGA